MPDVANRHTPSVMIIYTGLERAKSQPHSRQICGRFASLGLVGDTARSRGFSEGFSLGMHDVFFAAF